MSPSPSADPITVRASDSEREEHARLLAEHSAAGRLTPDEHSERLDAVYAARTRGDLAAVLRDLPATGRAHAPRPRRPEWWTGEVRSFVLVNLLLIAIWAATGAGYFWPVWPLFGWGIGIAMHTVGPLGRRSGPGCGGHSTRHRSHA